MVLGSRTAKDGGVRTFAEAAAHGEVVVNATGGIVSIDALTLAGAHNLAGKPLLDISNALDHSGRFPAQGRRERLRLRGRADPGGLPGGAGRQDAQHDELGPDGRPADVAGPALDVPGRRRRAPRRSRAGFLHEFGWTDDEVIDLGDLTAARALELYLPLWLRLYGAVGGHAFNIHVVRG